MIHRHWRTEHGLPQGSVFTIVQDHQGYIWFGTESGLVRFDGVSFKTFNEDVEPRIPHNFISSLLIRFDGSLWAGTRTGGLMRYRNGKFEIPVPKLAGAEVTALAETSDHKLWIGTRRGLYQVDGTEARRMDTAGALVDETISTLCATRRGLWIGTASGGLTRFENGRFRTLSMKHLQFRNKLRAIAEDEKSGDLWVAYDGDGLFHVKDNKFVHFDVSQRANESIQALRLDHTGALWIGTQHVGLYRYAGGRLSHIDERYGLTSNDVQSIFEDAEGSIWAGTLFGGLNQFRPGPVRSFSAVEGLPGNSVSCVLQKEPGIFWIGTRGAGLLRCDHGEFEQVPLGGLLSVTNENGMDIRSLCQDSGGKLWIGFWDRGLGRLNRDGSLRQFDSRDGLPGRDVSTMFQARNGMLWVGTVRWGIALLDPVRERVTRSFTNDFLRTHIRCFAEDSNGTMWIGTQNGLARYANGQVSPVKIPGLADASIRAIHPEGDDVLWLATRDDGLVRYTPATSSLVRFDPSTGLAHNRIYNLHRTETDFWLAGNRGIEKVPLSEIEARLRGEKKRISTRLFTEADGLRTSECAADSTPGLAAASDGTLWIATRQGLAVVDPALSRVDLGSPHVVIETVDLDHSTILPQEFERVPAGTSRVEIRYTALSFLKPGKMSFCYKLHGVDTEWVDVGPLREATYYNLRPGTYKFEVAACNDQGPWAPQTAKLAFSVAPRFYQTMWFYGSASVALAGVAGSAFRWRVRSMRSRTRELEGIVESRTREIHGEASQRREVENQLRTLNAELEQRVTERTGQLSRALEDIQCELRERQKVEHALARSEARFRRIVESGMVGILFWNRDGSISDANDTFLSMIGYSREDLENGAIRWDRLTPEEHSPADQAALEQIRQNGVCVPFEKEYIRKDGTRLPIMIGGASLSPDGERGTCFVLDISRHKAQEEEIRRLNQSLEARVQERTTELARANEQLAAEVQERKRVAVALSSFSQLGQRLHSARTENEAAAIIAATARSLIPHQSCAISLYDRENRLYPIIESAPVEHAAGSSPGISVPIRNGTRVIGVLELKGPSAEEFNIGDANTLQALGDYCGGALDRIHAEEARRETERRFSAFMANAPALAWMKDAEFRYVFTNKTFDAFTGHADIVGKTDFELWPQRIAARLREHDLRVFENAAPLESQESLGEEDGRVLLTLRFLFTTATGERLVAGMAVDITEQKRAEEVLHRLPQSILEAQEKERRRVARELHDGVNQAIASIKFRIQTAEQQIIRGDIRWQETCSKTKEMLDAVLQQVRRLSRNLRPGELDDFGLIPAVRSACQEFEARTGIEVRLNHSGIEERLSSTLELSLYRIVQESLTNIEKHSGATAVNIQVEAAGGQIRLEVSDNGRGIDFPALSQARRGLGLLHMRERAGLAGGTFQLHSQPGSGVHLIIEAPLNARASAQAESEQDA